MPDIVWSQPQVAPTPSSYVLTGAWDFELLSVQATFDGSGAGSAFLPALQLLDPGGNVMASCVASSVAAGASAAVSWFPGLAPPVPGSGIFYGIQNTGIFLDIALTGTDSGGFGMNVTGNEPVNFDNSEFLVTASTFLTMEGDASTLIGDTHADLEGGYVTITCFPANFATTVTTPGVIRLGDRANNVQIGDDVAGTGGAVCDIRASTVRVGNSNNNAVFVGFVNTALHVNCQTIGFFSAVPIAKPTVTGAKGGNAALASLLTALANLGLLTDNST